MVLGAFSVLPVAVLGAWSTARRAARVRPAEALRDAAVDRGVMTLGRWTVGLLCLAGAIAIAVSTGVQARGQHGESELLDDLVASPPAMDPGRVKAMGDLATASTTRLREAIALLEAKATPQEVEAYRGFVLTLARAAAEAHREGGFMGVGGSQVSETEQAALDDIAATLRTGG